MVRKTFINETDFWTREARLEKGTYETLLPPLTLISYYMETGISIIKRLENDN